MSEDVVPKLVCGGVALPSERMVRVDQDRSVPSEVRTRHFRQRLEPEEQAGLFDDFEYIDPLGNVDVELFVGAARFEHCLLMCVGPAHVAICLPASFCSAAGSLRT